MSNFDMESIEEELHKVVADIANIKGQIEAAKARQKETGEYADAVWFAKVNSALRYKQARHQELMRLSGQERRRLKHEFSRSLGNAFMDAAREILDRETFEDIMDAAHYDVRMREINSERNDSMEKD